MGILMLINEAFSGKATFLTSSGVPGYAVFVFLILVSFVSTAVFQNYMVELTNSVMFSLELSVIKKVRTASYESFEKMGAEKIYAAIGDTRILSRVPEIFVTLINSLVTIACSFLYFFWISPMACLVVLLLMSVLLVFYLYRNGKIEKDLNKVRDLQDVYYFSLRELLGGFRQIRISWLRNNNIYNRHILHNRNKSKDLSIQVSKKYVSNELTGVYSWYLVLGLVIYLIPAIFKTNSGELAAFITTVLFMMSPVSRLIMVIPFYATLRIAVERIGKIDEQLEVDALPDPAPGNFSRDFNTLRFEDIYYRYISEDSSSFTLELEDFNVSKGEIIFIVGGNGCGKTTFINLLTALCRAQGGKIFIDEQEVDWLTFSAFSNNMAVVYTNQILFQENYDDHDMSTDNRTLLGLEHMLNLNGILKINAEENRADVNLSRGQQKRLALLLALLEDKPIVVLDEWAAEQDPRNKKLFYTEWLQEMKRIGKTVIAVTHDEDFYHVADRVVRFEYGKIIADTWITKEPA
jgi:ABC-type siderophore export system fused ATPase/permease subunit